VPLTTHSPAIIGLPHPGTLPTELYVAADYYVTKH